MKSDDHASRPQLSAMTGAELDEHIRLLRADAARLAELLDRDRNMLSVGPLARPLGKLSKRLATTQAKAGACKGRLADAEFELGRRRMRTRARIDWDEPTLTDLERLEAKLCAS